MTHRALSLILCASGRPTFMSICQLDPTFPHPWTKTQTERGCFYSQWCDRERCGRARAQLPASWAFIGRSIRRCDGST